MRNTLKPIERPLGPGARAIRADTICCDAKSASADFDEDAQRMCEK
jgi:hypothetical protein